MRNPLFASSFTGAPAHAQQHARRHITRNRIICVVVVIALLVLFGLLRSRAVRRRALDEDQIGDDDVPLIEPHGRRGAATRGPLAATPPKKTVATADGHEAQDDDENDDAARLRGRRVPEVAPDAAPGDIDHLKAICQAALPGRLLRTAMSTAVRSRKSDQHKDALGLARRPRALLFVGDSHALRMFRWAALMLHFGGHLRPESSDAVAATYAHDLDKGVSAEKPELQLNLVPNAARLLSVQFRRAVFVADAAAEVEKLEKEAEHARRNADDSMRLKQDAQLYVSQKWRREMDVTVFVSVGSWDILRPEQLRHGFTLESILEEVTTHLDKLRQKERARAVAAAVAAKQRQGGANVSNEEDDAGLGVVVDATQRRVLAHRRRDARERQMRGEAIEAALEPTFERWRSGCEQLHRAIESAIGVGDSNSGALVGSHIRWRWPGPPNCSAARFQPPRASAAQAQLCPYLAEQFWPRYADMARTIVSPVAAAAAAYKADRFIAAKKPFDFYEQVVKAPGCAGKRDGVHPSHLCAAKEAGAALLRALS